MQRRQAGEVSLRKRISSPESLPDSMGSPRAAANLVAYHEPHLVRCFCKDTTFNMHYKKLEYRTEYQVLGMIDASNFVEISLRAIEGVGHEAQPYTSSMQFSNVCSRHLL
jgi:hypothetical protein